MIYLLSKQKNTALKFQDGIAQNKKGICFFSIHLKQLVNYKASLITTKTYTILKK
jgi:hypothetical protein